MTAETVDKQSQNKPWQFQPGQSGNPKGRTKGARNKLGEQFLKDLLAHWETNGTGALDACLKKDPAAYCRVVASILPREIKLDPNPLEGMTDAQLVERYLAVSARIANALGGTRRTGEDDRSPATGDVPPVH